MFLYFHSKLSWVRLPLAVFATFGMHGIIKTKYSDSKMLLNLNFYAFVIYLFNVPFIGVSKAILLKFMPWDAIHFLIFLPVLFACGLLGPIFLKKYIFSKVPFLDKLTA